jgi:hypothetical protein
VDLAELGAALSHNREPGFDLHAQAGDVVELIVAQGAYQLELGNDLAATVELLRELLGT